MFCVLLSSSRCIPALCRPGTRSVRRVQQLDLGRGGDSSLKKKKKKVKQQSLISRCLASLSSISPFPFPATGHWPGAALNQAGLACLLFPLSSSLGRSGWSKDAVGCERLRSRLRLIQNLHFLLQR